MVTNGPYELTRWDFKRRLILKKSRTYWDRANVKCDTIEMVVSENVLNQFLLYEAGTVDWVAEVLGDLPAELKAKGRTDLRRLAGVRDDVHLRSSAAQPAAERRRRQEPAGRRRASARRWRWRPTSSSSSTTSPGWASCRRGPTCRRTARCPISAGSPARTTSAQSAGIRTHPRRSASSSPSPPATPAPACPYDIDAARKLLAEAGYPDGRGFPPLPILFNTDSPVRNKIAESLKTQWRQALNIEVNLQAIEGKIFKERVSKKDYAIATVAWYGDYPDISTFTDKYKSDSLQNDSDWQSPAFDALLEQAAAGGGCADAACRSSPGPRT